MAFGWLTKRFEKRQAGTVSSYLSDVGNYLSTDGANVSKTAAVEFCLGLVGRAFMLAEVQPQIPALNPQLLSMMARQTISLGNAVFQVDVGFDGQLSLLPVAAYDISGNVNPNTWRYQIEQERPTGEPRRRSVEGAGIVHVRYMPRPSAPWEGVSPLVSAGATADQLAKIERSLDYDASPRGGLIMPLPDGSTNAPIQLKAALTAGLGAVNLVETTAQGFGQGITAAPKEDYVQKRFGAMIPPASIDLREAAALWILDALGVPATLHTSQGSAQREAYRHFFTSTIVPSWRSHGCGAIGEARKGYQLLLPGRIRKRYFGQG